MTAPVPPRRRWLRFSLRTGFVLLTVFGVLLFPAMTCMYRVVHVDLEQVIKKGMTPDDVRKLAGEPNYVTTQKGGMVIWTYKKDAIGLYFYEVFFDDGQVAYVAREP